MEARILLKVDVIFPSIVVNFLIIENYLSFIIQLC